MALYTSVKPDSSISSVEFSSGKEGNIAAFTLKAAASANEIKQWMASEGLEFISEAQRDNQTVLITRSTKTPEQITQSLQKFGNTIAPFVEKKKFNPWAWRGITSVIGQSLQLVSSWKSSKTGTDRIAIAGFASSNLAANFINVIFGGQKKDDPHQLRLLKQNFNKKLSTYIEQTAVPDVNAQFANLYKKNEGKSFGNKTHDFLARYSVSFGEIGLRFFGATSLSFPITNWAKIGKKVTEGSLSDAIAIGRNSNPVTYKVGLMTLLGKVISFGSKEPDPFNPKAPSWLDKIREKVTFKLSSVVEGVAAGWMAYDRYFNQKITLFGKQHRDYFGTAGNIVFIGGYIIRLFAPYGTLEVNMDELRSHITQGLSKLPEDKIPQLLTETILDLKSHFKNKPIDVAVFYQQVMDDLKQFHRITLPATAAAQATVSSEQPAKIFADESLKKSSALASNSPPPNYQDKALLQTMAPTALGA